MCGLYYDKKTTLKMNIYSPLVTCSLNGLLSIFRVALSTEHEVIIVTNKDTQQLQFSLCVRDAHYSVEKH